MHKWVLPAALLALTCGCSKKQEKETEPVAPVQVTAVSTESMQRVVSADAVLFPKDQATVSAKVAAPVRAFYVNRGDRVRQGQALAELESRDLVASLSAAKGQLEAAEANFRAAENATAPEQLSKAKSDLAAARETLDAAQKLVESRRRLQEQGALPRRQVDEAVVAQAQARNQFETAQDHLRALERAGNTELLKAAAAQAQAARGQYQAAQAAAGYADIKSPISGVVADRPLFTGEMANPGAPLITIVDVSRVVARASVPQSQAALLKPGMAATITQNGVEGETAGHVSVVSPAVDPNATTVQVWVEAANPGERLRPGAAVRVSIVAGSIEKALVVPEAGILPGPEGGVILMEVNGSVAHARKVEVGIRQGGKAQILSGIKPGAMVVTSGGVGLEDGAKVKVIQPGEADEGEKEGKDKDDK